jgi:hypothetical protein
VGGLLELDRLGLAPGGLEYGLDDPGGHHAGQTYVFGLGTGLELLVHLGGGVQAEALADREQGADVGGGGGLAQGLVEGSARGLLRDVRCGDDGVIGFGAGQ